MEAPAKIAEECKAKIMGFQELLPLITAICNGGLHARHWEQIAAVVGFDVKPDEVTSLRRLLDYNIQEHVKVTNLLSDNIDMYLSSDQSSSEYSYTHIFNYCHCHQIGSHVCCSPCDHQQLFSPAQTVVGLALFIVSRYSRI